MNITVVKTGGGLGFVAKYLLDFGYSVTLDMQANKPQRLEAVLGLRVVGRALPDTLAMEQGESLIIGTEDESRRLVALGTLPDALCEPLERVADLIDG